MKRTKSKLSMAKIHYEYLESDPDVLLNQLYKKSKSFRLTPTCYGWQAKISKRIDGQRIDLVEVNRDPNVSMERLLIRLEKAGL